jgi:hypothetical protein
LVAEATEPWAADHVADTPFDAIYPGPLPQSARDEVLSRWLIEHGARPIREGKVAVALGFDGSVNLGDIATGKVKHTIDGLWPLLGGPPGDPNDSRIFALFLGKNMSQAPPGGARIFAASLQR